MKSIICSDPSYKVTYYIKWVTTSWTQSIYTWSSSDHGVGAPKIYILALGPQHCRFEMKPDWRDSESLGANI